MPWLCGLAIAIGFSVVALATSVAVADMPGGDKKSDMLQSQAESATKPSSANPQEAIPVEELERQLRSSDFKLRQQAMMQLWSNRERYRPWVEQAVNDNDPEVVRRATWILDRWKRGLLPQLPAHVMEKLQSSSGPDTIEYLLNFGCSAVQRLRSTKPRAVVEVRRWSSGRSLRCAGDFHSTCESLKRILNCRCWSN